MQWSQGACPTIYVMIMGLCVVSCLFDTSLSRLCETAVGSSLGLLSYSIVHIDVSILFYVVFLESM